MSRLIDNLVLNPSTKRAVKNYLATPAHALLVIGQAGSGKTTLAKTIAAELLGLPSLEKLDSHPYFTHLFKPSDKQTVPIEEVRAALARTSLKNTNNDMPTSAVIFIENASNLGQDAQNVLLKDLEEPNPGLVFIITANSIQNILPTVASRCQKIKCTPISVDEAVSFFHNYNEQQVRSAWALAGGVSGLTAQLLVQGEEHRLKVAVAQVKQMMGKTEYERLIELEKLAQDKQDLQEFITAQEKVLEALHRIAINQENNALSDSILKKRRVLAEVQSQLVANSNSRLVATRVALEV